MRLLASAAPAALLVLALAAIVAGAEPTTVPTELLEGGDLRSEGEGPGLVGNPLLILAAVVALGVISAGATALIARLSRRD